jgi:hypothetical protein
MKWSLLGLAFYCAVASLGCGSSPAGKALVGSYNVMIAANGKSDPDIMTVSLGSGGSMLLTFAAGITTDTGSVNPDGLRATLKSSSMLIIDPQPAHIDHSTGQLDGRLNGSGTINGDGSCDLTLHFMPANSATPQDYAVTGAKL